MRILNLTTVGRVFLIMSRNWKSGKLRITIENGKEKLYDDVLIDNIQKVNEIYKFLLEHWATLNLQISYKHI